MSINKIPSFKVHTLKLFVISKFQGTHLETVCHFLSKKCFGNAILLRDGVHHLQSCSFFLNSLYMTEWSWTRQAVHVSRNVEAPSCNHCCSGKEISSTYSQCVSVALGIQHAMRIRRIGICDLTLSTIFFHMISQTVRFSKISYWTQNVCLDFLHNVCRKHFSF